MSLNMNNKTYDFLNALVRIILPASGTMYFGLSQIWGIPYATEVVGTIAVVTTFLGIVILLARNGWKTDDQLVIDTRDPDQISFGFESGMMIDKLKDGQTLTLGVRTVKDDE